MAYIRFSIQVDIEDEEPSRVIRKIDGRVFEYVGESDREERIGDLCSFLVQPGLAFEKGENLYDAMDSISDDTAEYYAAVFDPDTNEWNASVQDPYSCGPISSDLLYIDRVELDEKHRGKGIGRLVVQQILETFGLHCGEFGKISFGDVLTDNTPNELIYIARPAHLFENIPVRFEKRAQRITVPGV
jgi:predicted GNAT family acetyltransferase